MAIHDRLHPDSSSPLVDCNGASCARTSVVVDFSRLELMRNSGNQLQQTSKGKIVAASVLAPVNSTSELGVRVNPAGKEKASLTTSVPIAPIVDASSMPASSSSPSWVSVAQGDTKPIVHPLQFVAPVFTGESHILTIPPTLLQIGRKKFSRCLVGQFMGNAPNIGLMNAMASKLWGKQGPVSVTHYKASLFLFQFPTEASLSRALFGGPWHIGGIPLLLRQWSSIIEPVDFTADTFPVWVQLRHVPPELLTSEGLSYLASVVGKPMHTTQDYSKVFSDRANVCVDVDFSKPLVSSIPVNIDGSLRTIDVSYSWKPEFCEICKCWGHHQLACTVSKPLTTQWIPKMTAPVPNFDANPAPAQQSVDSNSLHSVHEATGSCSLPLTSCFPTSEYNFSS
ncbi:hypothetical protein Tsubulata_020883 [Turnera subulata]|uniref:DUF4283 domain-containing protein n=1 Tax=Turnera subulata TaxID=218843 RepID=A0A9Q0FHP5_9ROSI|nr:hypothetical protein Tsubulata_020883 [Turnera subulata]